MSVQKIDSNLWRRPRLERVWGATLLTHQMSENTIDDSGIGDKRNDLQGGATGAKKRVGLEYFLDKARPGCPTLLSKLGDRIG